MSRREERFRFDGRQILDVTYFADGRTETSFVYNYDEHGKLINGRINNQGRPYLEFEYGYMTADYFPVEKTVKFIRPGGSIDVKTTFICSPDGIIISMRDLRDQRTISSTEFKYDGSGRMLEEIHKNALGEPEWAYVYEYSTF